MPGWRRQPSDQRRAGAGRQATRTDPIAVGRVIVPATLRVGALDVDPEPLAREAVAVEQSAPFVRHFNLAVHEGEWSGATLRGPDGDPRQIYPDPTGTKPIADSPLLAACPETAAFLARLRCPVQIARYLVLGPGSLIRPHNDEGLGFDAGIVRLHVPLVSAPEVCFELDGAPVPMAPGECWYLDFRLPHAVRNESQVRRIHLVVDCEVDDWLTDVFASAVAAAAG